MVAAELPELRAGSPPILAGSAIEPDAFYDLRRRLILDGCKWDPQVGDVETISRFPLIIRESQWSLLRSLAAKLASELMAAEQELLHRPDLHGRLGLGMRLRHVLRLAATAGVPPCTARTLRFDFHWTDRGWQISEVNSDVPGGFSESSELPALMAEHFPETRPAGHPGNAWADAIAYGVDGETVGLLSAVGYMEDRQIMAYLARLLQRRGVASKWIDAINLKWRNGHAYFGASQPLSAIVRFYQAEWLNARRLKELFAGTKTPVNNPGTSAMTESKRFPLVWDELGAPLPTWKQLLPETRDPRRAPWRDDLSWLVKSAMCNTGDTVAIRPLLPKKDWKRTQRAAWLRPGNWVAQRRFNVLPCTSPVGPIYPCLGVYTINGQVAGIYGRYSSKPLIDFSAVDVAVLIGEGDLQ